MTSVNLAANSGPGGLGTASNITNLTFLLPAGGTATLADDGTAGNGLSQISGPSLVTTLVANNALAINGKTAADIDTINLGADGDFTSSLTVALPVQSSTLTVRRISQRLAPR